MTPDEIIEVLQGVKSGRKWERFSMVNDRWQVPDNQSLGALLATISTGYHRFRLAPLPDEITIPARTIPTPLRAIPANGDRCFLADPSAIDWYIMFEWSGGRVQYANWERGLVFREKDKSIQASKAMCPYA